jgi:hypothetical protein
MSIWTKISLFFFGMMFLVGVYWLIKGIKKLWMNYQANKDRSYNVFDKAEFNAAEKSNLAKWRFVVPQTVSHNVK